MVCLQRGAGSSSDFKCQYNVMFSCYNIFLSDSLDCFSSAFDPTVSDLKPFVFKGDPPINQQSLLELLLLYVLWPAGFEDRIVVGKWLIAFIRNTFFGSIISVKKLSTWHACQMR